MIYTFQSADWDSYRMNGRDPFRELESPGEEISVVDAALKVLNQAGIIPHVVYDKDRYLAFRKVVAESFEIPWTSVTPRMQRLIWAINAIIRPQNMIAAGVFCGNTFVSNAGAAVGPGAVYSARNLIGVEIIPEDAERAERNVRRMDPTGFARVVTADAVEVVRDFSEPIDLLYLDADNADGRGGKDVYLDILKACLDRLVPGSVVLAHDSVLFAERLQRYLDFVRDESNFRSSVNVVLDLVGLEVSVR